MVEQALDNGGTRSSVESRRFDVGDARLPDRFWSKVAVAEGGCWQWTAFRCTLGYGWFRVGSRMLGAHRVAWAALISEIPDGLVVDHLCRNRGCCNPAHLRVCTQRENLHAPGSLAPAKRQAAQTHCRHGHPLSGPNLYVGPDGRRVCRTCKRRRKKHNTNRPTEASA